MQTISRRALPDGIAIRPPLPPLRPVLLGLGTALATLLAPEPALANRLLCEPVLAADAAEAPTELAAKRAALERWLALAGKLGPEYTRWQNAFNRELACTRTADGGFRCQAAGQPCKPVYKVSPDARILPRRPVPSALDPAITTPSDKTAPVR